MEEMEKSKISKSGLPAKARLRICDLMVVGRGKETAFKEMWIIKPDLIDNINLGLDYKKPFPAHFLPVVMVIV